MRATWMCDRPALLMIFLLHRGPAKCLPAIMTSHSSAHTQFWPSQRLDCVATLDIHSSSYMCSITLSAPYGRHPNGRLIEIGARRFMCATRICDGHALSMILLLHRAIAQHIVLQCTLCTEVNVWGFDQTLPGSLWLRDQREKTIVLMHELSWMSVICAHTRSRQ